MQNSFRFISEFFVFSGLACGLVILADIFAGRPQKSKSMIFVWFLTGLWASWIGLYAYLKIGRTNKENDENEEYDLPPASKISAPTKAVKLFFSTLLCGAGCFLANISAEILGSLFSGGNIRFANQWILNYSLSLLICTSLQYAAFTSDGKSKQSRFSILLKAVGRTLPIFMAWQTGALAYSATIFFGLKHVIATNSWDFWFMMQLSMFVGCMLASLVNEWLVALNLKNKRKHIF